MQGYYVAFKAAPFDQKHTIAGFWTSVLLASLSIFVSFIIFREQKVLQEFSNNIQERQILELKNDTIKAETEKAASAFELNTINPLPLGK